MSDDVAQFPQEQAPQPALLKLSGRAHDVAVALGECNGQAASLYESAHRVLMDAQNPARIRLAACGLREILTELHDAPKPEDLKQRVRNLRESWDVAKRVVDVGPEADVSSFAPTLDAFFDAFVKDYPGRRNQASATIERLDPSGRVAPPVVHRERGKVWMDFSDYFSAVLHGGKCPTEEEFRSEVEAFDGFVLGVLRPTTFADLNEIDRLIAKGAPGD